MDDAQRRLRRHNAPRETRTWRAGREVEHDGKLVSLAKLVQTRQRQLTKTDPELVALQVLVIKALR